MPAVKTQPAMARIRVDLGSGMYELYNNRVVRLLGEFLKAGSGFLRGRFLIPGVMGDYH